MFKLKSYLFNTWASSLIGLAVWVVYEFSWGCLHSFHSLILQLSQNILSTIYEVLFCMGVGAVIGTMSMLFCFHVFLRLSHIPWIGYLTNFWAVAFLNIVGALVTGERSYRLFMDSMWPTALVVSELLSFFLGFHWHKKIVAYKLKLEEKKASLES